MSNTLNAATKKTLLTYNSPIARTRNPQHFTFNIPPTMITKGCEPNAIHGVRTTVTALSQFQSICKIVRMHWESRSTRSIVAYIERPCTAWDGKVPRGGVDRR